MTTIRRRWYLVFLIVLALILPLGGCGGGGSSPLVSGDAIVGTWWLSGGWVSVKPDSWSLGQYAEEIEGEMRIVAYYRLVVHSNGTFDLYIGYCDYPDELHYQGTWRSGATQSTWILQVQGSNWALTNTASFRNDRLEVIADHEEFIWRYDFVEEETRYDCPSDVGVGPASQYFPLAQYNQWIYAVTYYTVDSAGLSARLPAPHPLIGGLLVRSAQAGQADDGPEVSLVTVQVSRIIWIAGSNWFEAEFIEPGLETGLIYYRHDANGLLECPSEHHEPHYRIRQPIEVGQKWTWLVGVTAKSYPPPPPPPPQPVFIVAHEFEITSLDDVVEVSAGTFTGCLCVEENARWSDGSTSRGVDWFAPGVGIVAGHYYLDGVVGLEAELVEYSLR